VRAICLAHWSETLWGWCWERNARYAAVQVLKDMAPVIAERHRELIRLRALERAGYLTRRT
jgi:hypothetical protein